MTICKKIIYWFALSIAVGTAAGCNDSTGLSKYERLVKKELASEKRYDSLFLGIHLGMTNKTFFGHCWELNKKGILTDGNNNTAVLYKIKTGFKFPVSMNFYPDFYEGRIATMRVGFQYDAWAPWNKNQFSDSLLPEVIKYVKSWYPGTNDFIEVKDKTKGTIYVKVDGNRRIIIGIFNDMLVKVDYTDLLVEKKMRNNEKK